MDNNNFEARLLTADDYKGFATVYNDFRDRAVDEYKFELEPLGFDDFVNKKIYNSTINDILQKHCKNADIPVITIHGLRHTHASLLAEAGIPLEVIQDRLGHKEDKTTMMIYLHVTENMKKHSIDLFEKYMQS